MVSFIWKELTEFSLLSVLNSLKSKLQKSWEVPFMSMNPPYMSMAEPSTTVLWPFLLVGIWVCTQKEREIHLDYFYDLD